MSEEEGYKKVLKCANGTWLLVPVAARSKG